MYMQTLSRYALYIVFNERETVGALYLLFPLFLYIVYYSYMNIHSVLFLTFCEFA